jgi:hypothetical protein
MRNTIPLCVVNRHQPVRQDVTWDGLHYVGNCSFCGRSIRRKSRRNWRRDWLPNHQPAPF